MAALGTKADLAAALVAYKKAQVAKQIAVPEDWDSWLHAMFPHYTTFPFAPHHEDFWRWLWAIELGAYQEAFVGIWSRGGGKSSSVEMGIAALAARKRRTYVLYVCASQPQADDHVSSVARMFESEEFRAAYPAVSSLAVGLHGNRLGWRQNRLRTASGFSVTALGLEVAARGAKMDEQRPDLIVLDDIDSELNSDKAVQKKIVALTQKLLPTGSRDCVVLAVQNLVHHRSIFSRMAVSTGWPGLEDLEEADFISDRHISGPFPAVLDATYERVGGRWTVQGIPAWEGQGLDWCNAEIGKIGKLAFQSECQHEVAEQLGGMYDEVEFEHCAPDEVPDLVRIEVWTDPAVTDKDDSDCYGVQADGLAGDGRIYRLYSWEDRTTPDDAMRRAILKAVELKASAVGVETDQGGDTWELVYNATWTTMLNDFQRDAAGEVVTDEDDRPVPLIAPGTGKPPFKSGRAGGYGPKAHRQAQMLADYIEGDRIIHVRDREGTYRVLERALKRFPKVKPLDLADGAWWSWKSLRQPAGLGVAGKPAQTLPSQQRGAGPLVGGGMFGRR